MKKRMFAIIMVISVVASFISCLLTTFIYHNVYVTDAKNQLKTIVKLEAENEKWKNEGEIKSSVNRISSVVNYNIRFTIIDFNGNVVFDNWTQDLELENHKNRPEIIQAFKNGSGEYTRFSDTIDSDMYYYAVKINNNEVLRLSREINSINSAFHSITPLLFFLLVVLLIIVYIAANSYSRRLIEPIKRLTKSIDDILETDEIADFNIYEEFEPLSHRILQQKIKINQYIEELKKERDTIGIITENMREGFILLNKSKRILSINNSGKKMIGNNKFSLDVNKNILELTRNSEILDKINESMKENKHIVYDIDTSHNHFRYYLSPVKNAGLLILIEDVTIQKKAEIMRSEFSANVSHELKTPLTTMIGFAELIKEGLVKDLDDIQKYCGMINKEGLRLISLIEDIMRLSKIEEGIIENNSLVNLREVAKDVIVLLKNKAEGLNVKLSLNAEDISMKVNRNYFIELLYNLADNGIKYNKNGGSVEVDLYKEHNAIKIKVKDTGVGITEEDQDRIFERFYRVDKSRSKETGGTGLGLSIVKHIVELYEGTIELNSKKNVGTEILISFNTDNI